MRNWIIGIITLGIVPIINAIAKARRDKREQEAMLKRTAAGKGEKAKK